MDPIEFAPFAQEMINEFLPGRGWRFRYDVASERGGCCRYLDRTISMSRWLVTMWTEEAILDTLLHEIAHAMGREEHLVPPGSASHGIEWRLLARSIGSRGERWHHYPGLPDRWPGSGYRW